MEPCISIDDVEDVPRHMLHVGGKDIISLEDKNSAPSIGHNHLAEAIIQRIQILPIVIREL